MFPLRNMAELCPPASGLSCGESSILERPQSLRLYQAAHKIGYEYYIGASDG